MTPEPSQIHPAPAESHEVFEQWCVLSTAGALTPREWRQFAAHLQTCVRCRKALPTYQEIATNGMALLAPQDASLENENEWSPESAVATFMQRLQQEERGPSRLSAAPAPPTKAVAPLGGFQGAKWSVVLRYAAALLLAGVTSTWIYMFGVRSGEEHVNRQPQMEAYQGSALDSLLHKHDDVQHQLQARIAEMDDLRRQANQQKAEIAQWQTLKQQADETIRQLETKSKQQETESTQLRSQFQASEAERHAALEKVKEAEASLTLVQARLDAARQQHNADLVQMAKIENELVNSPVGALVSVPTDGPQPRPAAYVEARGESPTDPDLHDLMGARDLFIADVYDIDKSGEPKKAFGRVFYTKGKSLIFYAFDLAQQQQSTKNAGAFQVWGRRGYGDSHPLNMGVMYLDSETSKRWVFRYSDAKALSQVDAVFVTIEPHGGSESPKGKQLLYASLRTPPNHP
jgi:hypothetical protein